MIGPPVIRSSDASMVATYWVISASLVVVACGMLSASLASCSGRTDCSNGSKTSKSPNETPAPVPVAVHVVLIVTGVQPGR